MAYICSVIGISTPLLAGQSDGGVGGEHAFGDHAVHTGDDFVELASLAEFDADGAIARQASGAGEHQIAHTGEAGHGFGTAAASDGQARDFGEAAGDERGDGVVAQTEPVADAGGDGDHVLQRAAEFDADDVVVGVDPEVGVTELALHGQARSESVDAMVTAVGSPRATSFANDGPLSAPMRGAEDAILPQNFGDHLDMRSSVSFSTPLVALTNMVSGPR